MRKQLAAMATLVGLFVTLFLGVAAGTAQATGDPEFDCVNGVGMQICDNTVNVPVDFKVIITGSRALTNTELSIFEEFLDTIVIFFADCELTVEEVKEAIVDLFNNEFGIPIQPDDVIILGDVPSCY